MFCVTGTPPDSKGKWAQWDGCVLPGNDHDAAQVSNSFSELSHKTKGLKASHMKNKAGHH
jgi:hypothetical protein